MEAYSVLPCTHYICCLSDLDKFSVVQYPFLHAHVLSAIWAAVNQQTLHFLSILQSKSFYYGAAKPGNVGFSSAFLKWVCACKIKQIPGRKKTTMQGKTTKTQTTRYHCSAGLGLLWPYTSEKVYLRWKCKSAQHSSTRHGQNWQRPTAETSVSCCVSVPWFKNTK